jgi:hypothetical protein
MIKEQGSYSGRGFKPLRAALLFGGLMMVSTSWHHLAPRFPLNANIPKSAPSAPIDSPVEPPASIEGETGEIENSENGEESLPAQIITNSIPGLETDQNVTVKWITDQATFFDYGERRWTYTPGRPGSRFCVYSDEQLIRTWFCDQNMEKAEENEAGFLKRREEFRNRNPLEERP